MENSDNFKQVDNKKCTWNLIYRTHLELNLSHTFMLKRHHFSALRPCLAKRRKYNSQTDPLRTGRYFHCRTLVSIGQR